METLERQVAELDRLGARIVPDKCSFERLDDGPVVAPPYDVRQETGQLRELWRMAGADPDACDAHAAAVRALVEAGKGPIAGGAIGLGATAYMSNLPAEGTAIYNNPAFARETERNDMPLETKALSALGGAPIDLRIPNVGVMAGVRLIVKGTLTVGGTGAVTSNYQWPWNLLKRCSVQLQGQTGLLSVEGLDLRARRQRVYRHPKEDVSTAPATDAATGNPSPGVIANGTYAVTLVYDLPVVHDWYTLTGAVYAQSDAVYLNWRIQPATQAELFTVAAGGTVAFTGTIYTTLTFFDIPFADVQGQGRKVLLPDLRWLHSMIAADKPFNNTGPVQSELIRTAGQLVMAAFYLDNGGAAQIDAAALDRLVFGYGGNRTPRDFQPIEVLLEKNAQDYNGRLRPGWAVLDFEIDNPEREIVYPKGVTELKVVPSVAVGTTINPNAKIHTVYETLFSGAAGA